MVVLYSSLILFLLILGGIFWCLGFRHRTKAHPGFVFSKPRYWLPVWRTRGWYTPEGYRQMIAGCIMVAVGGLIAGVFFLGGLR